MKINRTVRHNCHTRYKAKAIGSGAEGALTSLQESYHAGMTLAIATCHCHISLLYKLTL